MDSIPEIVIKGVSAAGGFLGGSSLLVYMKPKSIREAIIRVLVTTVCATMTAPAISLKLLDNETPEVLGGVAFGVGFIAWNVLGAIAQFFEARQGQDIAQIVKGVQNDD